MTSKFPTPGEVFEDTYRIEAILGSGGFARVYRAVEVGLERPVALKILRPPTNNRQSDSQRDSYLETLMERFQREALMLSKLRSSYTVNLYKYGKTDDGLLYMALEYIDGLSLAEILRAGKPLKPARVAKILKQVLTSLQEAHQLGMLHRDLKPANIMVYEHMREKDQVKLLDFGIAKLVTEQPNEHEHDLTGDGTLIGTPRYMAPEQIQGTDIGPAADIYALGLVAFELVTGERAIKGDSSIQIIGKQLAPQSFVLPDGDHIPPGLRFVINKMMEKDLTFRYELCEQVIEDLERPALLAPSDELPELEIGDMIETMDEVTFNDPEPSFDRDPIGMTTRENLLDHTKDQPFPSGRTGALFGIIGTLIVVGIVFLVVRGRDEPTQPPVPKVVTPKPIVVAPKPEKDGPEIHVSAKLDGAEIEGVTVLVDGVDKGVTPLTLKASEIRDTRVVARYKMPDRDEPVEDVQEVTDPRDVLFEFDAVVSELIHPDEPEVVKEAPKPKPKPKPPRKHRIHKPRDPAPANPNVYVAPE